MHQAVDEEVLQLDEEAEGGDAGDESLENLSGLVLHELRLLQAHDLPFGLHGDALPRRRVLGDAREGLDEFFLPPGREAAPLEQLVEEAVDDEVGVAAYRRSEVGVRGARRPKCPRFSML